MVKVLLKGAVCVGTNVSEHPVHSALSWMDYNGPTPGIGDTWDGVQFVAKLPPTEQELDKVAIQALEGISPELAAVAEALWQIAKAAKTSDWTAFEIDDGAGGTKPVASKVDFNIWLKDIYRSKDG